MSRLKIILQGSYASRNIGDRAIGHILKKELQQRYGAECFLDGYYTVENAEDYDVLIVGGGGILHDHHPDNLERRLKAFGTAKYNVVMAAGIPRIRYRKSARFLRKLNNADLITLRDEGSKEILKKYVDEVEIHATACPTFLMSPDIPNFYEDDKIRCGINIREQELFNRKEYDKMNEKFVEIMRKSFDELGKKIDVMYFIPFHKTDLKYAKDNFSDCGITFLPVQGIQETLDCVASMDMMISMRYHSLIYSLIAKVPSLFAINYSSKTKRMIKEFNINAFSFDDCISINFSSFLHDPEKIEKIYDELKSRAEINFELFELEVLDKI